VPTPYQHLEFWGEYLQLDNPWSEPPRNNSLGTYHPVTIALLLRICIPMGAGAAMSAGKKIRTLTATQANKKTSPISKGMMYWRRIVIITREVYNKNN